MLPVQNQLSWPPGASPSPSSPASGMPLSRDVFSKLTNIHALKIPWSADLLTLDYQTSHLRLAQRGWDPFRVRRAAENTDHRHRRLLRARRERPRGCRATEQRDEVAPSHVWMAPAWQEKSERDAQRSLAVMCPACSRSPDGLLALMESANRVLITR